MYIARALIYQKTCAICISLSAQPNREMARHVTDHVVAYGTRYYLRQEVNETLGY